VREPIFKVFDVKVFVPRLLQRLEIVQPATTLDSRNGTMLLPVLELAAAGGGPCCLFRQLVRVYVGVFDCGSLGCEAFCWRPLHVGDDFEHVPRMQFND
jgi:hypothetical protein